MSGLSKHDLRACALTHTQVSVYADVIRANDFQHIGNVDFSWWVACGYYLAVGGCICSDYRVCAVGVRKSVRKRVPYS